MPNIPDRDKKKKIKVTRSYDGDAPKEKSSASLTFEKGKETRSYAPADVRTGHKEYGKESATKPTPDFVKKAQSAKQDIVYKNGIPYRAGHKTVTKEPDKISVKIRVNPSIRPVKTTFSEEPTSGGGGKKKVSKLKPMRMVAGGSDKKGNPANKIGVGKGSGFKVRKVKSFKKPGA